MAVFPLPAYIFRLFMHMHILAECVSHLGFGCIRCCDVYMYGAGRDELVRLDLSWLSVSGFELAALGTLPASGLPTSWALGYLQPGT